MFWYAVRSKPNKERALALELTARNIDNYCPQILVKPANPRSRTLRPYFPGYLFVQVDLRQTGFSEINWVPYSQGLVAFGGDPTQVPDILIEKIRKKVEAINAAGGEQLAGLKQGDRVTISAGPFSGHEAVFDATLPGKERVRVLLDFLSRQQVGLEIPVGYIKK